MITKSKILIIAAVAAIGGASPAFAQSFDPDNGTGNVLSIEQVAPQQKQIAVHQSGLKAFAMVSRTMAPCTSAAAVDSNSPALTGGGSEGYDEELLRD